MIYSSAFVLIGWDIYLHSVQMPVCHKWDLPFNKGVPYGGSFMTFERGRHLLLGVVPQSHRGLIQPSRPRIYILPIAIKPATSLSFLPPCLLRSGVQRVPEFVIKNKNAIQPCYIRDVR